MDSNLSDVDSIHRAAVSRRGGVRVRGGRLPPIRIGNVTIATSNKKVYTPNIPQRRIQVKREILDPVIETRSYEETKEIENSRGRGRGRGSKVYLQTDGSFLGEGPALKMKKEPLGLYDKLSYVSSSRVKTEVKIKVDTSKINELLECYDEKEAFLDTDFKPVRLPFLKLEKSSKESKLEIKKDISTEDVKPFIKQEPLSDDEWNAFVDKYSIPIKKEYDFDTKLPDLLTDFKLFQDDNTLVLLQFPSCLPFDKACGSLNQEKPSSEEKKDSENEVAAEGEFGVPVRDLTEGYIGKLQVMESGRIQIIMGSVIIALEDGVNSESMWEAASISIENKNEGDLIMLGKIGLKMVLRPRLKCMMKKAPAEKDICTRTREH